jgi:hypothetical protein
MDTTRTLQADDEGFVPPKRVIIDKLPEQPATGTPQPPVIPPQLTTPDPGTIPPPVNPPQDPNANNGTPGQESPASPGEAAPVLDQNIQKVRIGGQEFTLDELENNARVQAQKYGIKFDELPQPQKDSWIQEYINSSHMRAMEEGYRNRNAEFNRQKAAKETEINRAIQEIETEKQRQKQLYEESKKRYEEIINRRIDEYKDEEHRASDIAEKQIARNELERIKQAEKQLEATYTNRRANQERALQELNIEAQVAEFQSLHPELITSEAIGTLYEKIQKDPSSVPKEDMKKTFIILDTMKKASELRINPAAAYEIIKDIYGVGRTETTQQSKPAPTAPEKKFIPAEEYFKLSPAEQIKLLREKQQQRTTIPAGGGQAGNQPGQPAGGQGTDGYKKFDLRKAGM